MSFSCHFLITDEINLTIHFVACPLPFVGMEEIDAEPRNNLSSVALFLPVERERIETVSLKIHHGIYLILNTFSEPSLRVLINGIERIPTTGRIAGSISVFSYRASTYLYPRLHCFHTFIYVPDDFGNVIPSPLIQSTTFAVTAEVIFVGE